MAVATVAELIEHTADYLEIVELGGRVFIRDGNEPVAELVPTAKAHHRLREALAELPPDDAEAANTLFLGEGSKEAIDRDILRILLYRVKQRLRASLIKPQDELAARIAELVAEGKARPPIAELPDDFFTRKRPVFASGSVLEALLEERRESRW